MRIWLRFALGIVLFSTLLFFVDWRQSGKLLLDITFTPTLLAISALISGIYISSLKWNILLRAHDLFIPTNTLFRFYWIGTFFNNCFPSTVGGDIVRLTFMRPLGRLSKVSASIVLERLTGLVVLLGLSALCLLMRPQYFEAVDLLAILWLLIGSISAGLILIPIFGRHVVDSVLQNPTNEKNLLVRVFTKINKVIISIAYYSKKRKALFLALVASLPFYGLTVLFQYLLFISLDLHVPFQDVLFIAPLIPLVSLIPISFNALGLAEGAFVIFYVQAGLLPEEALAVALLRRILSLLVSLVGGVFWLVGKFELPE